MTARAAELGSRPAIDLATDKNKDGIPDDLAAAVDVVATVEDKDAAIKDLVGRLPYTHETRAQQQQAEALHAQLADTTNPAEAERISGQIEAFAKQMEADPNYVAAIEALTTIAVVNLDTLAVETTIVVSVPDAPLVLVASAANFCLERLKPLLVDEDHPPVRAGGRPAEG